MLKAIKNHLILLLIYVYSLINKLQIALGLIKLRYGVVGYFEHKGIICSTNMHTKKRLDALDEFDDVRADDVIVLTYPKAGTHFTAEIILAIFKESSLVKGDGELRSYACSFEASLPRFIKLGSNTGAKKGPFSDFEGQPSPRIIVTHLPWNLLPAKVKSSKVKVIHCMRNPKDVVCSYYPFLKTMKGLDSGVSWKEFVFNFMEGKVLYGGFFSHLKQWYPHRNKPNFLNLYFEDMKDDLEGNVRKIVEYLNIELTQEQIDRIVVANTFENKKKSAGKGHVIYRKGKSGAWRSDITVEQNEMLDEWIEREMEDMPDLKFQYN